MFCTTQWTARELLLYSAIHRWVSWSRNQWNKKNIWRSSFTYRKNTTVERINGVGDLEIQWIKAWYDFFVENVSVSLKDAKIQDLISVNKSIKSNLKRVRMQFPNLRNTEECARSSFSDAWFAILSTAWSVHIRSFSGLYFPAFRLNTDQKNPNTDTFYAVKMRIIKTRLH